MFGTINGTQINLSGQYKFGSKAKFQNLGQKMPKAKFHKIQNGIKWEIHNIFQFGKCQNVCNNKCNTN